MKKILVFILLSLILINLVSAEVDEKALKKNFIETFIENLLKESGTTGKVSEAINNTNPEVMEDLNEVCEKTAGWRVLIGILSILAILGFFTYPPASIIAGLISLVAIINPFCWFSV